MNAELDNFANAIAAVALGENDDRTAETAPEHGFVGTKQFLDRSLNIDDALELQDSIAGALGVNWLPGPRLKGFNGVRLKASVLSTPDRVAYTIEIEETRG